MGWELPQRLRQRRSACPYILLPSGQFALGLQRTLSWERRMTAVGRMRSYNPSWFRLVFELI